MTKAHIIWGLLLGFTAAVSAQGDPNGRDFFEVARLGTVAEVQQGIDQGESLTAVQSSDGLTPFFFAVRYNKVEVAQLLLKAGSSLKKKDADGAGPLLNALMFNPDLAMTKWLLSTGASLTERDAQGRNAAMVALFNPNREVYRFVVSQGVKLTNRDSQGLSLLMYAVWHAGLAEVKQLIALGASVKDRDNRGETPLLWACSVSSDPAVIDVLLKAGAQLSETSKEGKTVIMAAAGNQNLAILRTVVAAGGAIDARDAEGATPLMISALYNGSVPVLQALIAAGADVNARDKEGKTPLMWATGNRNPWVLPALLKAGADPRAQSLSGETALSMIQQGSYAKQSVAHKLLRLALDPPRPTGQLLPEGTVALVGEEARQWRDGQWTALPGPVRAIAMGGNDQLWGVSPGPNDQDSKLVFWSGARWVSQAEKGTRLTVADDGNPWVVKADGSLASLLEYQAFAREGKAVEVNAGRDGAFWALGPDRGPGGYPVLRRGNGWEPLAGAPHAVRLAGGSDGRLWTVSEDGTVRVGSGESWTLVEGVKARSVATATDGTVCLVSTDSRGALTVRRLSEGLVLMTGALDVALP